MSTGIELTIDENAIATLRVNRPQVRNGLDWAAMQAFGEAVGQIGKNRSVRALVVTGAGETFVSGGDLRALEPYTRRKDGMRLATVMGKALSALRGLHCPTIAAINGPARGGGAEIAVACDQRIMAEDADIGFVHARLGITTAWGGARYLLQLVGYPTALELLSTARVLHAQEAKAIGLVGHLSPPGGALQAAYRLAGQMAQHPAEAVQAAKRLLRFAVASPLVARHAERRLFSFLWDSEFRRQAVQRFLKRG